MAGDRRAPGFPDVPTAAWTGLGTETPDLWAEDFGRFVSSEVRRWAEVVKGSGAKFD
ncbi:MAG: hypothetical protein JNK55_08155 [Rubrivivax sp.]|nr:hypothetical protein [Rubrivivax sp.]